MPLAHILMPQIARKAIEIEQALNPKPAGYLDATKQDIQKKLSTEPAQRVQPKGTLVKRPKQGMDSGVRADAAPATAYLQTVGFEKTPYDPRGLTNKKAPIEPNPDHPVGAFANMIGATRRIFPSLAAGLQKGSGLNVAKDGRLALGGATPSPIPLAPAAPEQLGFAVKPGVITLPKGAVGMTEGGAAVDRKGKKTKIGYLADPNVIAKPASPNPEDPRILEHKYRGYLQDMTYDRRAGTMKFPSDYFDGMSKKEVDDIKQGVKALQTLDKGTSI